MANSDFLQELNLDTLKEIAQNEGMSKVPVNFEKEDLVKYLVGVLTTQKLRFYKKEFYERVIERDVKTVHEKITERGFTSESAELNETTFDRNSAIMNLARSRINKMVIEEIANRTRENIPNGSGFSFWDKMSDNMLQTLHEVFIDKKDDKRGRFFEFRCAEWLARKDKSISKLGIDVKNSQTNNIEMDIIGYRADGSIRFMAECKDRSVKYPDITAWLKRAESLYEEGLKTTYFFSSAGYTQGTIDRVETMPNVFKEDGAYVIDSGGIFKKEKTIEIAIYDVRNGKFREEFPK